MNYCIVYPAIDGSVSIIFPTGELSIEEIAAKDVPTGMPYTIMNVTDIPEDRTFRDAWEYQS
jgi:hypothetical protein